MPIVGLVAELPEYLGEDVCAYGMVFAGEGVEARSGVREKRRRKKEGCNVLLQLYACQSQALDYTAANMYVRQGEAAEREVRAALLTGPDKDEEGDDGDDTFGKRSSSFALFLGCHFISGMVPPQGHEGGLGDDRRCPIHLIQRLFPG